MESAGDVVIPAASAGYTVSAAGSGVVAGTVASSVVLQPAAPMSTGADSAACGATVADESVKDSSTTLTGAVVWLEGVHSGRALPATRRIELESDKCRLLPRVQATVTNSAVNVLGHDDFRQHLRFIAGGESSPRASVLLGRHEQVIPTEMPFRTAGLVIVRDVDHSWPTAFIAVFDHPYYAVTNAEGRFSIEGVPAGSYTLHAWHERSKPFEQKVTVGAGTGALSLTLDPR